MTIINMSGFPATQRVFEHHVAAAQEKIIYPGIQQCLSVTGFSIFGLLGAHIDPGTKAEGTAKIFEILRSGGGKNYHLWYLVGNFREHFNHTKVGWNSTAKIVQALRENLASNATYLIFDTTGIADEVGGFGIDIHAVRNTFGVDFFFAPAATHNAAVTPITDPFLRA